MAAVPGREGVVHRGVVGLMKTHGRTDARTHGTGSAHSPLKAVCGAACSITQRFDSLAFLIADISEIAGDCQQAVNLGKRSQGDAERVRKLRTPVPRRALCNVCRRRHCRTTQLLGQTVTLVRGEHARQYVDFARQVVATLPGDQLSVFVHMTNLCYARRSTVPFQRKAYPFCASVRPCVRAP